MTEYIVEVRPDQGISFPSEVVEKMALQPGDKMIMRFDNTKEHLVVGKLPMDAPEKDKEIHNIMGKRISIK